MEKDLKKITLEDIFADPRFDRCIRLILVSLYYNRPKLEPNMRYKRSAFDSLDEKGIISLNDQHKIKEAYKSIMRREGGYSSRERKTIQYVIEVATADFYKKYIRNGHKEESGNESSHQ